MPDFSPQEIELLKRYVTDPTGDVFCVRNLPGLVGAAFARYSRARGGFRETLLKEFIKEGVVDSAHAEALIERILIAFGDDSVGELEGAHLSFENISVLATKEIEECRIGGSPIEQSTRYVFYDQRGSDGAFRYYTDPAIAQSESGAAYRQTMDFLFTTYCDLIEPMKEFYQKLKPIEAATYDVLGKGSKQKLSELHDVKDEKAFRKTYQMDIRTRACDTLRAILPISTKTNVGLFGNGRFYQSLVSSLLASPLPEARTLGEQALRELSKVIPAYVRRARANEYQLAVEKNMRALTDELLAGLEPIEPPSEIVLLDQGEDFLSKKINGRQVAPDQVAAAMEERRDIVTLALMLYPYTRHPLKQIITVIEGLNPAERERIRKTYIGERRHRRDRPYRAFESGYDYTFDLVTDFGTYKDLMRHRMNSQLRQRFSPRLGFAMPPDLVEAGYANRATECHDRTVELYHRLQAYFPDQASYATLHGSKVRWLLAMNDREAFHLLELRTTPQGHASYRRAAQAMHKLITERSAWRGQAMKFVDYNDYAWARADSEAKQRVKERQLKEKT